MKTRLFTTVVIFAMLLGLIPGAAYAQSPAAQVVVPVMGTTPTIVQVTVNDGPGNQTDPHVSGDWVSYTDVSAHGVRFQNLDMGVPSDRLIPHADNSGDNLSDISGSTIVFTRGSTFQTIYMVQINAFGDPGDVIELSPNSSDLRQHPAIGGDTIAFRVCIGGSPCGIDNIEIGLASVLNPSAPAYHLTNDGTDDLYPAVSPDGNVVVWIKCPVACGSSSVGTIWRAERTDGVWGAPEQVSSGDNNATLPDTNGPVTVYNINNGSDRDIHWSVKGETGAYAESVLDLPGDQFSPSIAGNLIVFYGNNGLTNQFDIYLYDLLNNRLYQLTNTSESEILTDISTGPGGLVRIVYVLMKPATYPTDYDVYAMSFLIDTTGPVITPEIQGTLGQNGWYTSDVTLNWMVTDNESPVGSTNGCYSISITSDQAATEYTCAADSDGGASSATTSIRRDATKPVTTVTGVTEGASYELGSVPQAGCATTDALSGVTNEATLSLTGGDAQGVGSITATCSGAVDVAGNAADPALVHYTVTDPASDTYTFTGFFQPVDNWPTENTMKAGASVPIKFSLGGDMGLNILASGSPTSKQVTCPSSSVAPADPIEETTTSNSGLTYDAASGQYVYVWKTNKTWGGTCRVFTMLFNDGSSQQALFRFIK